MKLLNCIDMVGRGSGLIFRWLSLTLSAVVVYEVISRYVFNRPTIWAFDTAMMMTSSLFLMGAAFVTYEGRHIRVDVIYNLFPKWLQNSVEVIFYLVFFFPFTLVMVVYGWKMTQWSWAAREISNTSQWGEPIYWWKGVIPLAFLLLFIQGVAEFIRICISIFKKPQENPS